MTLKNILDNIQYGEEYSKFKSIKESIENNYDKELNIFYASGRIKDIAHSMTLTESEEQKINRILTKLNPIEDRIESGKIMSEAYKKMQASSLMESCSSLEEEIFNNKLSSNSENIAKIVATTKYFVENYVDENVVLKESNKPLFNKFINEEFNNLKQVL